jgi:hypothetical protein
MPASGVHLAQLGRGFVQQRAPHDCECGGQLMKYRPWCASQQSGRDGKLAYLTPPPGAGAARSTQPACSTTRWGAIFPAVAVLVAPSPRG